MPVRALWYRHGVLSLIDQRALPGRTVVLRLRRVEDVAEAIRTLTVRGAPSIGVAAAYGMVLAARAGRLGPDAAAALFRSTRPTAYDLFVGIEAVRSAWAAGADVEAAADTYRANVVEECHRIGVAGAPLLARARRVLTHCNAGALATVEWGTALAPIRVARQRGGAPELFDRILATRLGAHAVDLALAGRFGEVAVLRGEKVTGIPLAEAVGTSKTVTPDWLDLLHTFDA